MGLLKILIAVLMIIILAPLLTIVVGGLALGGAIFAVFGFGLIVIVALLIFGIIKILKG